MHCSYPLLIMNRIMSVFALLYCVGPPWVAGDTDSEATRGTEYCTLLQCGLLDVCSHLLARVMQPSRTAGLCSHFLGRRGRAERLDLCSHLLGGAAEGAAAAECHGRFKSAAK